MLIRLDGRVVNKLLTGDDFDFHCHSNLTRAILPYGLAESDVHDVLNLFQVTGLNKHGEYFMYVLLPPRPCSPFLPPASSSPWRPIPSRAATPIHLIRSYRRSHHRRPREPSPATPSSYIEFFAEIDVLCALSACPGGDLSLWGWGEGKGGSMLDCCRPLGVEVYALNDRERVLEGWREPESPKYRGLHGLGMPVFEKKEGER